MLRLSRDRTKTLALAGVLSFSTMLTSTIGCAGRAPGEVDPPAPPPPGIDPFCASRPSLDLFCEDFDENPLPGRFDDVVENRGTVTIVDGGTSAPSSVHTVTEDVDGSDASLVATFEPGIKHRHFVQMAFDEADADNDDGAVDFAGIDFENVDGSTWRVALRKDADGSFSLVTQRGDDEETLTPIDSTIATGVFTTVRLDVFFNDELAPPGRCTEVGNFVHLKFRDDDVLECVPVDAPDPLATPTFWVGTRGHGGVWGARHDNVVFDVDTE